MWESNYVGHTHLRPTARYISAHLAHLPNPIPTPTPNLNPKPKPNPTPATTSGTQLWQRQPQHNECIGIVDGYIITFSPKCSDSIWWRGALDPTGGDGG